MVHSDNLVIYPHRVKVKVATYFFKEHVTIPTLAELHGEILSKPTVVHLKDAIKLYEKESKWYLKFDQM